jgi:hypothetical protein
LAGALAEWTGGKRTSAEVSEILAKAMLGEREGLKALGISISAADIEMRLFEKGQQDLTGAAMQQAKALATQELIFEKSADAQAAFAEGSNTAARKQAELRARNQELSETVGEKLLPVQLALTEAKLKMVEAISTHVLPAIEKVITYFKENEETTKILAAAIGGVLVVAFGALTVAAGSAAIAVIAATWPLIAILAAAAALGAGLYLLITNFDDVKKWLSANWPEIATIVSGPFAPLVILATDSFGIRSALIGAFESLIPEVGRRRVRGVARSGAVVAGEEFQPFHFRGD